MSWKSSFFIRCENFYYSIIFSCTAQKWGMKLTKYLHDNAIMLFANARISRSLGKNNVLEYLAPISANSREEIPRTRFRLFRATNVIRQIGIILLNWSGYNSHSWNDRKQRDILISFHMSRNLFVRRKH